MDELAHRTVAKIFGGTDPMSPFQNEQVQLGNYLQRVKTGRFDDLYARHSLDEMGSYMEAMEKLAAKYGGA